MASFDCRHYPISMFAAFVGTYCVYLLSAKTPHCIRPMLSWIGRHTMLILCYHTLYFFIMLNVAQYLLYPHGIELSGLWKGVGSFCVSLGLPLAHTMVSQRLRSKHDRS